MKSFAQYVQLVESLCPKCGMDPCHCGEVATNEAVEGDEKTHVFHATVTRGRSGALGSTELHHVKAKSREEATSKLHKDLAAHDRKLHRLEYKGIKEELTQVDEMTQGKEYTQQQLMKKIQSGNWEATHDIKPGKHVEMRHHSGKRVTVQVKEELTQVDEADRPYMTVGGVRKREDDEGYGKQKPSGNMSVGHAVHINGRHWKSFDSKAEAQRVSDSVQKKYPDKKVSVHSKLNFH